MSDGLFLAGRLRRLGATAIDALLVPALTLLLVMATGVVEDTEDYVDNWWMLHVLLLAIGSYLLLNGLTLAKRGQTLGKWAVGIVIARAQDCEDGQYEQQLVRLWKLVCIRALFFPLLFVAPVMPFGLIPMIDQALIFGKRRRCVHDLACSTVVLRLVR